MLSGAYLCYYYVLIQHITALLLLYYLTITLVYIRVGVCCPLLEIHANTGLAPSQTQPY